jgi:hypothetical protein
VRPYIEAAVLNLTGDRATVLAGGIQAYIRDELNVDVPILKLKKATNRFLSQTQTTGMSTGFNLATWTPTASYSEGESDATRSRTNMLKSRWVKTGALSHLLLAK